MSTPGDFDSVGYTDAPDTPRFVVLNGAPVGDSDHADDAREATMSQRDLGPTPPSHRH